MKFCPHCGTDLTGFLGVAGVTPLPRAPGKYDQTKTWRAILEQANARQGDAPDSILLATKLADQIAPMLSSGDPVKTIIHLAFDRKIVPEGGALYMAAMSNGQGGPTDLNYFRLRGYLIEDDKVRVQDDVPVGAAYGVLDYWGGAKQHPRWHLACPIQLNASRMGDPFFMDESMVAFGATWKDGARLEAAFMQLFELFAKDPHGGGSIARPLVAEALRA